MNKNSGNIKILYLQLNPDSSLIVRHETEDTIGSSKQELGLAGPSKEAHLKLNLRSSRKTVHPLN